MSANLYWRPNSPTSRVNFNGGSTLVASLQRAFGTFPIDLTEKDIPKLEGIKACGYDQLDDVIGAIYVHEAIQLTVEY